MRLVLLHGAAAAGKLTTARELERLVGYPVFHNHLIVDALTAVFPFGTEPFVRLREEFWLKVFAEAAGIGRSLTFTFAPESTVTAGFAERVRQVVEEAGGRVCFVRLTVTDEEQERRIGNADRREFHKLSDVGTLHRLREHGTADVEQPPVDLEILTDRSAASESAALIVARFGLRAQVVSDRYPPV
ncbi:hypothetical protein ACPW96_03615 [Micromonospora sp. DT81.3]|uniref:hypothetical protein n=1 Tax=Micromonospora sp. DT81.3 TaxID=3416523 RepID=UPI003CEAF10D